MLVNIYRFIAKAMQIQQQSKFYASGLSNYPALTRWPGFFPFDWLSSFNLTYSCMEAKDKHTKVYLILKVTASWLKYEHLQSIHAINLNYNIFDYLNLVIAQPCTEQKK